MEHAPLPRIRSASQGQDVNVGQVIPYDNVSYHLVQAEGEDTTTTLILFRV
jgi:hypothetical protein